MVIIRSQDRVVALITLTFVIDMETDPNHPTKDLLTALRYVKATTKPVAFSLAFTISKVELNAVRSSGSLLLRNVPNMLAAAHKIQTFRMLYNKHRGNQDCCMESITFFLSIEKRVTDSWGHVLQDRVVSMEEQHLSQWDAHHKPQDDEIWNTYASQGIRTWNTDSKPRFLSQRLAKQIETFLWKKCYVHMRHLSTSADGSQRGQVGCNLNIFGFQHIEALSKLSWHLSCDEICLQGYFLTVFEKVSKTREKKSWKQPCQNDVI